MTALSDTGKMTIIKKHTTHISCNHSNGKDCCICSNHDCLNAKCPNFIATKLGNKPSKITFYDKNWNKNKLT